MGNIDFRAELQKKLGVAKILDSSNLHSMVGLKSQQKARKEKMIKHNFVLGIHGQNEFYKTSNQRITQNEISKDNYLTFQEKRKLSQNHLASYKFGHDNELSSRGFGLPDK